MAQKKGQLRAIVSLMTTVALIAALFSACAGAPAAAKENEAAARTKVIVQTE